MQKVLSPLKVKIFNEQYLKMRRFSGFFLLFFFFFFFLIVFLLSIEWYIWYKVILKKNWPYVRLKWGLEASFGTHYQKSVDVFKFVITQVSYISQQKKVKNISHVRLTEGLTN